MNKIQIAFAMLSIAALASCSPKEHEIAIAQYQGDKKAAVSFTYDDGIIEHYTLIAPQLEANGLRGTFWIIGASVGTPDYVTWEQIKEMAAKGHEMSNHTWTHPHLPALSEEQIRAEIKDTDDALEACTGHRPVTIAFPYNDFNDDILAICAEEHIATRTYQTGQGQGAAFGKGNCYSTLDGMKEWLQGVIDGGEWGVTMTHGIHIGWDTWEDPQVYWDFLEHAGTRADEVWFGTFEQVAAYTAERDACTLSVKAGGGLKSLVAGRKSLTVTPSCSLDPAKYTQPLTLRVVCDGKVILKEFDPFGGSFIVKL